MVRGVSSLFLKRKSVDKKSLVSLTVLPENLVVQASQGSTILDALLDAKVEIDHSCGGMGTCGTCRVYVEKGLENFVEPQEAEKEIMADRQFAQNERLCCQNQVQPGLVIRKPN
jgi:ferredoxin, 2Fe-2S